MLADDFANGMTLRQVAEKMKVTLGSATRWIHTGVMVGGRRVKLLSLRVGGRYRIPVDALDQFIRDCNPAAPVVESPASQARRLKAEQEQTARLLSALPVEKPAPKRGKK